MTSYVGIVGVALWMLGGEAWRIFLLVLFVLAALGGLFLGALMVWFVIRYVNRRADQSRSRSFDSSRSTST